MVDTYKYPSMSDEHHNFRKTTIVEFAIGIRKLVTLFTFIYNN